MSYNFIDVKTTIAKGMHGRFATELRNDLWSVVGRLENLYGGVKFISPRCIVNGLSCEGWAMPADYCNDIISVKDLVALIADITDQRDMMIHLPLCR